MSDNVNHPKHYTQHPSGVECVQITEHFNFNVGNAVKYLWRAGLKGDALEDLRKARWYVEREIGRVIDEQKASVGKAFLKDVVGQMEGLKVGRLDKHFLEWIGGWHADIRKKIIESARSGGFEKITGLAAWVYGGGRVKVVSCDDKGNFFYRDPEEKDILGGRLHQIYYRSIYAFENE